jgi:NhaA family Na+:H+ antiporter
MATDIAFAVGILALLGKRVPAALRVLLLALAVIDDLGAIVVIALFYSSGIEVTGLVVAAAGVGAILAMQRFGVRTKLVYVVPGLVVWGGIYAAGIHPTIAGVMIGVLTPVRAWLGPDGFRTGVQQELDQIEKSTPDELSPHDLGASLDHVNVASREALSPADSLIRSLHPWVAFGIMPVFALANAGVRLSGGELDPAAASVMIAVAIGLIVGKPVGVLLACWLALRLRIGTLPIGMNPRHLLVLGVVAGVGFTMALFIAQLAFADPKLLAAAKLGVLGASFGAAVIALVLGRILLAPVQVAGAARTADEAEASTVM